MVLKGKALVLGCSLSGLAAADLLLKSGYVVYVTEYGKLNPKYEAEVNRLKSLGVRFEFEGHTKEFMKDADFAVTSPSIPNNALVFKLIAEENIEVISELDLAYRYAENKNSFIGITGTNGKTTVTSLVSHILSLNLKAPACGNIGYPPSSIVLENPDWFVTEVSSFQLEKSVEFRAHIACWTNFTPDHVTWHGCLENYYDAKRKLFENQLNTDFAVINGSDAELMKLVPRCKGKVFVFDKKMDDNCCYMENGSIVLRYDNKECKLLDVSECQLCGYHNYQNIMCAIIMTLLAGASMEQIKEGVRTFKALEHRMENFARLNDITFYNDSKATNPESAIAAIDAFSKDMVLIAGGRDKMTPLEEFCKSVKLHADFTILIGEATERFKAALKSCGYDNVYEATSLQAAVDKAIELKPKSVLLSPACASFDMFSGYEERGRVFKEYVLSKIAN